MARSNSLNVCILYADEDGSAFSGRFPGDVLHRFTAGVISADPLAVSVDIYNVTTGEQVGSLDFSAEKSMVLNPFANGGQITELVTEDKNWKLQRNGKSKKAPLRLVRVYGGGTEGLDPLTAAFLGAEGIS